jgi:hypothetical protein
MERWTDDDDAMLREHADPLRPARGVLVGVALGAALWTLIGAVVWLVVQR